MEKQYYKPKIEEFHPTFRYESCIPFREIGDESWKENWIKHEYSLLDFEWTIHTILTQLQFDNAIRVKYLDHLDIIEAGWVEKVISGNGGFWNKGKYSLHFNFETSRAEIVLKENEYNYMRFVGKIANYNKLLDVMKMLEIGNNK